MNLETFKDLTIGLQRILNPSIHTDIFDSANCFRLLSLWIRTTLELFSRADITPYGYHETERKNTIIPQAARSALVPTLGTAATGSLEARTAPLTPRAPGI